MTDIDEERVIAAEGIEKGIEKARKKGVSIQVFPN